MAESEELKKIKKIYGEKFMHLCREFFPTILECDGKLLEILTSSFSNNSPTLYEDITKNSTLKSNFKNYVYGEFFLEGIEEKIEQKIVENKNPYELLSEAGYDLIECTTEEEIQSFKKYYALNEELCTFNGGRLDRCVVFFAVRKDVDDIKREDYDKPERQDTYGTSVMGIQFNKEGVCTVSIKNRYNHAVDNPDATYGNNLDRIIPGLTHSFEELLKERGLELNSNCSKEKFDIPKYVVAEDGKYYKYNMEINGVYYCPGNIIIENGKVHELENKEKQVLIDYFVLDTEKKTIQLYDSNVKDSFADDFKYIERIDITKDKEKGNGVRTITITIDKNNQIIGYKNEELEIVGNNFLHKNEGMVELNLPNVIIVGNDFLKSNWFMEKMEMSNVRRIGNNFLHNNRSLDKLEMSNVIEIGNGFMSYNSKIKQLEMEKLETVGNQFFVFNFDLKQIRMPNVQTIGDEFNSTNQHLEELEMPNVIEIGNDFIKNNKSLKQLKMPSVRKVGNDFLETNRELQELEMPCLVEAGKGFCKNNQAIENLELPSLTEVGNSFFRDNETIRNAKMPALRKVGHAFLFSNKNIEQLEINNLEERGIAFLDSASESIKKQVLGYQDIARLDKENELTTSEVSWVRKIIEKIQEIGRKLFQRNDDRSER